MKEGRGEFGSFYGKEMIERGKERVLLFCVFEIISEFIYGTNVTFFLGTISKL